MLDSRAIVEEQAVDQDNATEAGSSYNSEYNTAELELELELELDLELDPELDPKLDPKQGNLKLEADDNSDIVPNLYEFQQAKQYNEALTEIDTELTDIPGQLFGEQLSSKQLSSKTEEVEEYYYDNDNLLEVIPYRRSKEVELSRFTTALGLWYKEAAISRV